ncbi:response regulator transcription factor [Glutamicibacter sp. MNS18]|uniref:response regulator n=1 Tax=Glutamicibacter sp. MNS18 TaxID=2989817 RepID=UPI0022360B6D|nr:response regulator transcription factor [Glutamicibacter sp. MNS18]MCW4467073.1 response regulator transcription factor [Glutamicibacter sp. MNS18]
MNTIRVVIADDQPLIVSSLKLVLETDPLIRVVGTANTGYEAISTVTELRPEVVLMDIQMPELDGIAATGQLVRDTAAKIIVLTTFNRDDYLFDALDAGASGFLLKNTEPETLIHAVHQVAAGHGLLAPEVTLKLIRRRTAGRPAEPGPESQLLQSLTERERQVLALLATGGNNQEIAAQLGLSEATVKTHLSNLLAKTNLRDRVQAVLFAHRAGLIQ